MPHSARRGLAHVEDVGAVLWRLGGTDEFPEGWVPLRVIAEELDVPLMSASTAATWGRLQGLFEARYVEAGVTDYGLSERGATAYASADGAPDPEAAGPLTEAQPESITKASPCSGSVSGGQDE